MLCESVSAWMKQPTSVAGAAVLLSAGAAYATGQATWQQASIAVVGGLVGILLPDNSAAKADAVAITQAIEKGKS